jgi:hypothetical protein
VLLDVLTPGLFALDEPPVFVPTVDVTVHFAPRLGDVGPGWRFLTNRTVWATRDFCVDESTLHDRDGHPLAQVRQAGRSAGPPLKGSARPPTAGGRRTPAESRRLVRRHR